MRGARFGSRCAFHSQHSHTRATTKTTTNRKQTPQNTHTRAQVIEKAYKKLRLDALVIQQGRLQDSSAAKVNKDDLLSMVRYGAELVFSSEAANITGALRASRRATALRAGARQRRCSVCLIVARACVLDMGVCFCARARAVL